MKYQLRIVLLWLLSMTPYAVSQCSNRQTHRPKEKCIDLFEVLQVAFFNNSYNAFHAQSLFYPSSHISPTLVKALYTVNVTDGSSEQPLCGWCTKANPCVFGWTLKSLYQTFHPALLAQLQFQLPFAIMRYAIRDAITDMPDLDVFLWDGTQELPSLFINITINNSTDYLNCTESNRSLLEDALREINKLVSV